MSSVAAVAIQYWDPLWPRSVFAVLVEGAFLLYCMYMYIKNLLSVHM